MELRITNKILDMAEDPPGFDVQPPVSEAREELAALTSERDRLREALKKIASGASYDRGIMDGKSFASFPYIARAALDKDA